ncbi:hypothetical protein Taro_017452 [Colocasia esculenta]|uniref:Uncharacterized protein n=1 Tax=Colocasia esculenta TaxID=4460 RepID=A0A843UW38_COLES|nr:hypothetical protein [Colocasia esculenta]
MAKRTLGVRGHMIQECVDTVTECVDTLSQLRQTSLLGDGSSVDTLTGCVDTLSQSGNWVFWRLALVSTHSLAVSTHCPSLASGSSGDWV